MGKYRKKQDAQRAQFNQLDMFSTTYKPNEEVLCKINNKWLPGKFLRIDSLDRKHAYVLIHDYLYETRMFLTHIKPKK